MPDQYALYFDSRHEAEWLLEHSKLLHGARLFPIEARTRNEPTIEPLIQYDRPDVIVCKNGKPILTVEKTKEVPTGHNVGQRMARLVRSVECGIPVIYKAPFDARKHGTHSNPCFMNIRLLEAFTRMTQIHGVPIVAVNTPVDENHEIIETSQPDAMIEHILNEYAPSLNFSAFHPAQEIMRAEYNERLARRAAYAIPPSTVTTTLTSAVLGHFPYDIAERGQLMRRRESVVYTIGMTPEKCRREDPYTGMTFIYDYTLCRVGPTTVEKSRNLFLSVPHVTRKRWLEANPNEVSRKSSNWYLTCTALLLKDGYLFVDDGRRLGNARFI